MLIVSIHPRFHGIHIYKVYFCVRYLQSRHGNSSTCGIAQKCWPASQLVASVLLPSNKHFPPSLSSCLNDHHDHQSPVIKTVTLKFSGLEINKIFVLFMLFCSFLRVTSPTTYLYLHCFYGTVFEICVQ